MAAQSRVAPPNLKAYLDRLYATYDLSYLPTSAAQFPHRYHRPEDIELVGFIASCFAYGRVEGFAPQIDGLLAVLGNEPHRFLLAFDPRRDADRFRRFSYRFNTARDAVCLLWFLRQTLERYGSLRACYLAAYRARDEDTRPALTAFASKFLQLDPRPVYGQGRLSPGMHHLLPSPDRGGACKRLHLFLRWMVRQDHIDFGLWPELEPAKLIIPLDTHVAQVSRRLRLTRLKSPGLAMALEITGNLKRFDPADPVKYDFALCRLGMLRDGSRFTVHGSWPET
ncbi:MAG: TIGR02757 family protein [candidate division NC10 bacterium]|nr:TIGR02757 family protein [candidate division NC10 bacterium]